MKKKCLRVCVLAGFSMALLAGMPADAAHVILEGGECEMPLLDSIEEDGKEEVKTLTEFGLLGYVKEGILAISTEDSIGYIKVETLSDVLPELVLPEELPNLEGGSSLGQGSYGEAVTAYQEALIDAGFLTGAADGDFGGMSAEATKALQTKLGLDPTGTAGPVAIQAALDLKKDREVIELTVVQEDLTVEEKFNVIVGKTRDDLDTFLDYHFSFSFDPFEDRGIIDPKICLGEVEKGTSDLERMQATVNLKLLCVMDYITEMYSIKPIFEVIYTGTYRPYIKGAQLSAGSEVTYLTDLTSENKLDGIHVVESAYITMDDIAFRSINNEEMKSAVLRIQCQDNDIDVPLDLTTIWCRDALSTLNLAYEEEVIY